MRFPRMISTAVALLFVAPLTLLADEPSSASLNGLYGFEFDGTVRSVGTARLDIVPYTRELTTFIGTVELDGAGTVIAATRFLHLDRDGDVLSDEVFRQTGTGTYDVNPDGTGSMTITWTPDLLQVEPRGMFAGSWSKLAPTQTVQLVLLGDGFAFRGRCSSEEFNSFGSASVVMELTVTGRAERVRPTDARTTLVVSPSSEVVPKRR